MEAGRAIRNRPRHRIASAGGTLAWGVFTSIDGTLLDARTLAPGPNARAVRRLIGAGVPVIPVSVMTLDELTPLAAELGIDRAMVIEGGGAIARWTNGRWEVEPCGPPSETLLEVVREIEDRSGADLIVCSALSEAEASRISRRIGLAVRASVGRWFSEPFVIERGDFDAVRRAARALGFCVRRGRRFLHLCRECDEGEAFLRLREELRCERTVALGSAAADAGFLSCADIAVVVPGPDGRPDPELMETLPHARVAPAPAPDGWAAVLGELWKEIEMSGRRIRA